MCGIGCHRKAALLFGPQDLKTELRQTVAKLSQIQILDHQIGDPTIGWNFARALHGLNLGVWHLIARAVINPKVQIATRDLLSVRPYSPDPGDLSFA